MRRVDAFVYGERLLWARFTFVVLPLPYRHVSPFMDRAWATINTLMISMAAETSKRVQREKQAYSEYIRNNPFPGKSEALRQFRQEICPRRHR